MRPRLWFACTFVLAFAVSILLQYWHFRPTQEEQESRHRDAELHPRSRTHQSQPAPQVAPLKQIHLDTHSVRVLFDRGGPAAAS